MHEDKGIVRGERLELVVGADQWPPGERGHTFREASGEALRRIEAGSNRRAALSEGIEMARRLLDPRPA